MSESRSRLKYGFSYDSNEKQIDEIVHLGYGKFFHVRSNEHLLQIIIFEELVEFGIFYRDLKNCFSS